MIKWLLITLVALGIAAALAVGVVEDPGYILLGYKQWTVETTLALFVVGLLAAFLALYYGIRGIAGMGRLPRRAREWRQRRRGQRARANLNRGLIQLAEGQWEVAEKRLTRHVDQSDNPLLGYLAAARAAQQQGAHERRDHYLRLAHQSVPEADVAVGLTQAELQIAHQQLEQALATLTHLRQIAPRHGHVLKMLMRLYLSLHDWHQLHELLPELRKRGVVEGEAAEQLEQQIFEALLVEAAHSGDLDEVRRLWNHMPTRLTRHPHWLAVHAERLQTLGAPGEGESLVRAALRRSWDERLVYTYGHLDSGDAARQLGVAENWLEEHSSDPVLLFTLARLALANRLWGKARNYLEASIGIAPTMESYRMLGQLLEQLGEPDKAMECYRKGMAMAHDGGKAVLPGGGGSPQPPLRALPGELASGGTI